MRPTSLAALLATATLAFGACAAEQEDDVLSWEEFQAMAFQEPDTGIYIINGDEPVETLDQLAEMYHRYLDSEDLAAGIASTAQPSIVNQVNGQDDKWSAAAAMNLTYCVSKKEFGARYSTVVAAMASATAAWEQTGAKLNFVHDAALDGNCTARTSVTFNVGSVCTGQYLARAFFPSSSRRSRNVLIDCTSFGNIAPWTLTGVLRHELGHAIGLRHEHTRPEAGTCFENNAWRALTAYDSDSVMHYPHCNGTQAGDLVLTAMDVDGARALYP